MRAVKAGSDSTFAAMDGGVPTCMKVESDTTLVAVCRLTDIPVLGARVWPRPGDNDGDIAIFRTAADRVFAVRDRCPHQGGPLSQGIVFGDRVACPLHNWTIELCDGRAVAPDLGCTRTFPVRIDDGIVHVALSKPRR
jgi:nitrite reductase (NADH) small subunit